MVRGRSTRTLVVSIPLDLYDRMVKFVGNGCFMSFSDFVRFSIRYLLDKLERGEVTNVSTVVNSSTSTLTSRLSAFNELIKHATCVNTFVNVVEQGKDLVIAYCTRCEHVLTVLHETPSRLIGRNVLSPCCLSRVEVVKATPCRKVFINLDNLIDEVLDKLYSFRRRVVEKLSDEDLEELDNILTLVKKIRKIVNNEKNK